MTRITCYSMINTNRKENNMVLSYSKILNINAQPENDFNIYNNMKKDINLNREEPLLKFIKIGIHNVRGFNRDYKRKEFMDFYRDNKVDIIGLSETKINKKTGKNIEKAQKKEDTFMGYKIWFEGIDEENTKTEGVALAINEQLVQHVTEIGRYMGRIIWAILKYKGKLNLWIINIYVNSDLKEKTERKLLLKKLKDLLKNAEDKKEDVILLGNLNADREKWEQNDKLQNKEKYLILETIKNADLFDTQ